MKEDYAFSTWNPSQALPVSVAQDVDEPWVWFLTHKGKLIAAGSEVCQSICWEAAEIEIKKWSKNETIPKA